MVSAQGADHTAEFFEALGQEVLRLEAEFNRQAGFTLTVDELPEFFDREPLPPTGLTAPFHAKDVQGIYCRLS